METWRKVWRDGVADQLSTASLAALQSALIHDDECLLQGATCEPQPLLTQCDYPVEAACVLGYGGWRGDGLRTVGEVEEFFARCCFEADQRLGEPAAIRWFLNWYDETPRPLMRSQLLAEVNRTLVEREGGRAAAA